MNNIEKIKAEIKRLMKETDASQFGIGGRCMCRIILDFIDSLSEEKPSEDLEKAAEESLEGQSVAELFCGSYEAWQMLEMFKAGSEWRYQKDRREFAKLKAKEWSDGYDEGIAKGKEQMMKDTVEGEVIYDLGGFFRIKSEAIDGAKYKVGSWVKLIIVNED